MLYLVLCTVGLEGNSLEYPPAEGYKCCTECKEVLGTPIPVHKLL